MSRTAKRRWSASVKTVSTHPPPGTFMKDAQTIARIMGSRRVSPNGIGSGIRMIQFFINRAGSRLSAARKTILEDAKHILQEKSRSRNNTEAAKQRKK